MALEMFVSLHAFAWRVPLQGELRVLLVCVQEHEVTLPLEVLPNVVARGTATTGVCVLASLLTALIFVSPLCSHGAEDSCRGFWLMAQVSVGAVG